MKSNSRAHIKWSVNIPSQINPNERASLLYETSLMMIKCLSRKVIDTFINNFKGCKTYWQRWYLKKSISGQKKRVE